MSVEIEGLTRIIKKLEDMTDLRQEMSDIAKFVEGDARERAPKDTGRLKGSIESGIKESIGTIEATVFTPVEYAPYQEFGTGLFAVAGDGRKTGWAYEDPKTGETVFTRGNRPHPFMGPALRENKDVIMQVIKEGLNK